MSSGSAIAEFEIAGFVGRDIVGWHHRASTRSLDHGMTA
jgi:hypothetical protein